MKLHYTLFLLVCSILFNPLYGQLELNPQNKLRLNSTYVPGGDLTIGVDSTLGGIILNATDVTKTGVVGFSVDGVLKGYAGFDHTKMRYNTVVDGQVRMGVIADATRIFNQLKADTVNVKKRLTVGDDSDPLFTIDDINKKMYFNYNQIIGSSDFVLNSSYPTEFGGMYINSEDVVYGKPFYGYSNGGNISAFHYYDDEDDSWHLTVDKEMLVIGEDEVKIFDDLTVVDVVGATPTFQVQTNNSGSGHLFFNATSSVGLEDFTLNSDNGTGYGGMYVNIDDASTGKPFYGYSVNNSGEVFHFFDASDGYWKLNNNFNEILQADNKEVFVNGSLRVANKVGIQPEGTIYYNGVNFFGVIDGGVIRQLDNTTNLTDNPDNKNNAETKIQQLENENKILTVKLENLESRLQKLENIMMKNGIINE